MIALRERNLAGKPKPSIDELRALAEAAGKPAPKKAPKGRIIAQSDEIPDGKRRCPMCDGTGIADATVAREERVLTEKDGTKGPSRKEYMRDLMRKKRAEDKAKRAREGEDG